MSTTTNDFPVTNNHDKARRLSEKLIGRLEADGSADTDTMCGLRSWRPVWLQRLANHNVYTVTFIIVSIVRGLTYAYFNGTVTTLEKVFGISSSVMGFILTGNDMSQMLCGMAVSHFGGRGSRPLWIAIGMVVTAAGCFICASCQLLWDGSKLNALNVTGVDHSYNTSMCWASTDNRETLAESDFKACDTRHSSVPSVALFFVGQFIFGAGSTALASLGFTYMDDNVKKRHSPLYIGASQSFRALGPTLGYLLSSFCLRIYIVPNEKPEYSPKDPRWLGAWWLGFLVIGTVQLLSSFPMLLFPKSLPSQRRRSDVTDHTTESVEKQEHSTVSPWKDFMLALKRLVRNRITVFYITAAVLGRFGVMPISIFLPKYLEAQFGVSASRANMFTGMSSKLMMMVGTFLMGFIIWKFKPRAVYITSWNAFTTVVLLVSILTIMGFDCNDAKIRDISVHENKLQVTSTCSTNCNCDLKFDPVCLMGQRNFLSPCLAGCTGVNRTVSPKMFYNCVCGLQKLDNGQETATAVSGYCPDTHGKCGLFGAYVLILGVARFITSTSRLGSLLIFIRSVQKRDKALAMAFMTTTVSLLAFIPGPIIFGMVADSTCLLWENMTCGRRGNCWLYNVDQLRYWFHGIMATCFFGSFLFDVLVCIHSRHLNLYDEDCPEINATFRNKTSSQANSDKELSLKLTTLETNQTK